MIRQTPRLVNLASRSVAAAARNADSKQQLALRAFADSASSTEAKRTVSSPFAKEDIDPLDVFAAIDTNNDGVLQKDEFLRAVDMLNYDEVRAVSYHVMISCVLQLAAILQLAQVSTSPMGRIGIDGGSTSMLVAANANPIHISKHPLVDQCSESRFTYVWSHRTDMFHGSNWVPAIAMVQLQLLT